MNAILISTGAIGLVLAGLALTSTIRPAFDGLERRSVDQHVAQAQVLLQSSLSSIENATKDYAVWDSSYDYFDAQDPAFEAEIFTTLAMVNVGVNAIAYVRFDGELLNAHFVDLESEKPDPELETAFVQQATSNAIRARAKSEASLSDFVIVDGRVLAIAAAQVVRSDGTGTPAGYVVMAKELTREAVSAALQISTEVTPDMTSAVQEKTKDTWKIVLPVSAPGSEAAGTIAFELPRDTSKLGARTILSALLTSAFVMAGTLLALFLIVNSVVVRRLGKIDQHMRKVAQDGQLVQLADDLSSDEIGALSRSFNTMLAELRELREQLELQSFQLGKSESAAGAMHNVRNSLNPVSVILSQALSEKAPVKAEHIDQALNELSSGETDTVRRERLAAFLRSAFAETERKAAARRETFLTAKASLNEAIEILRSQNDTAQVEIPIEQFDILDLVRKNALLARFAPWGEIDLEIPDQGMLVCANRLLLSQVIANLLTNAVESIVAADRRPGRLIVQFMQVEPHGSRMTKVTITDDGAGFEPRDGSRLFERGHSSKKARSSGLGLHWCANTVKAMGGSLALESAGPGMGASAVLLLREGKDLAAEGAGAIAA